MLPFLIKSFVVTSFQHISSRGQIEDIPDDPRNEFLCNRLSHPTPFWKKTESLSKNTIIMGTRCQPHHPEGRLSIISRRWDYRWSAPVFVPFHRLSIYSLQYYPKSPPTDIHRHTSVCMNNPFVTPHRINPDLLRLPSSILMASTLPAKIADFATFANINIGI